MANGRAGAPLGCAAGAASRASARARSSCDWISGAPTLRSRLPAGAPRLVLTLTHACNLRCPYCPLEKPSGFMDEETAERAAAVFFSRHPRGPRLVKFFGGEPLLSLPLLRRLVPRFRAEHGDAGLSFFVSTNATLLSEEAVRFFEENPDIEVALSAVPDAAVRRRLPNYHLNVPIPPPLAGRLAPYVAGLVAAGIRRLNFLPGYYVRWAPEELAALERSFRVTAGLLRRLEGRGRPVEVINRQHWAPTPLYNHGMVVGPEGDVYPCNLVFATRFLHLQPELKLGSVLDPAGIRWERTASVAYDDLLRRHMDAADFDSTMAADRILTAFVAALS